MRNSGIERITLVPQHQNEKPRQLLESFSRNRFPFVFFDLRIEGAEADCVTIDNVTIACDLSRALIERGHERIGIVASPLHIGSAQDRYAGYKQALEKAGLDTGESMLAVVEPGGAPAGPMLYRMLASPGVQPPCSVQPTTAP